MTEPDYLAVTWCSWYHKCIMKKTTKKSVAKKKSASLMQTVEDTKTALLIVSLLINLFVVCLWVVLRITSAYDEALISFFLGN